MQTWTLGRSIADSSIRNNLQDNELERLIRNKQDLELQLSINQNRITTIYQSSHKFYNKDVVKELKTNKVEIIKALEVLEKLILKKYPDFSNLFHNSFDLKNRSIQYIRPNEAVISIYTGENASYIWSYRNDGRLKFHKSGIGKHKMHDLVMAIRSSLEPKLIDSIDDIPSFNIRTAYKLFHEVLLPIEEIFKTADHLVTASNSPLNQLPFSLLPKNEVNIIRKSRRFFTEYRNVEWLIKSHSISVVPSIESLIQLRSTSQIKSIKNSYAGFGDPLSSKSHLNESSRKTKSQNKKIPRFFVRSRPKTKSLYSANLSNLPRLPETAIEVEKIAETLGANCETDFFIGTNASESQVKNMDLKDKKVIVFATHALKSGDLDGLYQPALALSFPTITGESNNDGLLTMGEIMWLRLNADWVVLSACNTASSNNKYGNDAEAVSGLGQAFFYAGAKSLLVSHWPVESVSTGILTTSLFRFVSEDTTVSKAKALQKDMLYVMDQNEVDFSYSHPIFWAPFMLVGDN